MAKFVLDGIENIVGKEEKAVYQCIRIGLFTKQESFRLVQIESICRRQINVTEKLNFVLGKGEIAVYQKAFQKASFKGSLTLSQTSPGFDVSAIQIF